MNIKERLFTTRLDIEVNNLVIVIKFQFFLAYTKSYFPNSNFNYLCDKSDGFFKVKFIPKEVRITLKSYPRIYTKYTLREVKQFLNLTIQLSSPRSSTSIGLIKQSINQSTNQPINQSVNHHQFFRFTKVFVLKLTHFF